MLKRGRILLKIMLAAGLFLVAAEVVARLDDWYQQDVPFLANPDREQELTVRDEYGVHGRPHGHFQKWHLNAYGFRGPELDETPPPGTTRVMILGASETFGLHETEGKEYPAQLAEQLRHDDSRSVEIVNAAMAGITLRSMKRYWVSWASRCHPDIVLIYPSPIFYLDAEAPSRWGGTGETPPAPAFESRFADRVKETLRRTAWVRRVRLDYALAAQMRGRPAGWLFTAVPTERLAEFRADLEALVTSVEAHGARPVLLTHAVRVTSPPRLEDRNDLREMRRFAVRATEETIAAFEMSAAQVVRDMGRERGIPVIDVAAAMNGHRAWFADLAHFTDEGASKMAALVAEGIEK